ncbi:MAG TPA: SMI1/KNR4 family protein [Verrucomicrobiae bacterium]|jgi:hypothetical protein|nr:SMI1/KNR4 family protein [Verrucomicrobiae bacterium]
MLREEIHSSFAKRFSAPRTTPLVAVNAGDLRRVEDELKVTFPASYICFLTQQGPAFTPGILELVTGGQPEHRPEGAGFDVQEFFEPDEIIETHRLYSSGGMEDWLVPIAMDSMGNVFGFKREEHHPRPDDSALFFFDHEFCEVHLQKDSFDAWLESFLQLGK